MTAGKQVAARRNAVASSFVTCCKKGTVRYARGSPDRSGALLPTISRAPDHRHHTVPAKAGWLGVETLHARHVVARRANDYNLARPTGPRNAISAGPPFAPLVAVPPVGSAYPPRPAASRG